MQIPKKISPTWVCEKEKPSDDDPLTHDALLAFVITNYVFLGIFLIEFIVRLVAFGDHFFLSIWGVIDDLALWVMAIDAAIETPKLFGKHKDKDLDGW